MGLPPVHRDHPAILAERMFPLTLDSLTRAISQLSAKLRRAGARLVTHRRTTPATYGR